VEKTLVVAWVEVLKLRHDPTELFMRAVQPALWLIIFGEVFTQVHGIPSGGMRYLDFLSPGILAQSALFIAIFSGMNVIWERDLGIVHKYLVSPAPRDALALGKYWAAVCGHSLRWCSSMSLRSSWASGSTGTLSRSRVFLP